MADDKEQVPAAGDGPTQEDKANKEADAEDASEPMVKKIIRNPKFGLALKDYSEKVESDEDRLKRELEEDCCKRCCFPRSDYKSRAELVEELDQAKKDLAKETGKKSSQARTEQPSAAAPAPAGADVGAPYSADNNV